MAARRRNSDSNSLQRQFERQILLRLEKVLRTILDLEAENKDLKAENKVFQANFDQCREDFIQCSMVLLQAQADIDQYQPRIRAQDEALKEKDAKIARLEEELQAARRIDSAAEAKGAINGDRELSGEEFAAAAAANLDGAEEGGAQQRPAGDQVTPSLC